MLKPKLASFAAVIVSLLLLCCGTRASNPYSPSSKNQFQDLVGQECSPPFGFLRNVCGPEIIIEETTVVAPVYIYGPNTCRKTQLVQRNELDYAYQNYCDWVFNYQYYNYIWQCRVICQPTQTCSNRNQTFERASFECCPGFQVRPADDPSHYEYLFRLYYTPIPTLPVGCPRAVGNNVMDCLVLLGLTEFVSIVNQSQFFPLMSGNDTSISGEFTVFAPTNAAFAIGNPDLVDLNTLVGHHLIDGTVKESDLVFNKQFITLAGTTLHSTTVVFGDRSLYQYNPQYAQNNHQSALVRYSFIRFIGGARVVNTDACLTEGVTLQVIDRVLVPATETIASILEGNSSFSLFTEALKFARVFDFLNKTDVSRTVFVPTDDAFNAQIPEELFICLMYMRLPLHDLVLYHIAEGAEYTSSLSTRQFTYTLQLQPIHLMTDSVGTITFRTDPQSTIIQPDIPASNGVIHVVDNVLIPPNIDFGQCKSLVPTTPPPPMTTSPTTPPPSTTTPPPSTTTPPPMTTSPISMTTSPPDPTTASGTGTMSTTSSAVTARGPPFIGIGLNP